MLHLENILVVLEVLVPNFIVLLEPLLEPPLEVLVLPLQLEVLRVQQVELLGVLLVVAFEDLKLLLQLADVLIDLPVILLLLLLEVVYEVLAEDLRVLYHVRVLHLDHLTLLVVLQLELVELLLVLLQLGIQQFLVPLLELLDLPVNVLLTLDLVG